MSNTENKEMLDKIKYLDGEQQAEVFRKLRMLLLPPSAASFAGFDPANRGKPPAGNVFACPRCNKPTVIRNGVYYPKNAYGFTQRFLCKECRTTFSDQPDRTPLKKADQESLE
ncbi:MAG TPA: hypothetical protein VN521_05805, partial [Negativicutes bacterium]|nr:hypothetical protein [Negativicutes bacterium]